MPRNSSAIYRSFSGLMFLLFSFFALTSIPAASVTNPPILWTAGGLSSGTDSAG